MHAANDLSNDVLRTIAAHGEGKDRQIARNELRYRTMRLLYRRLPSPQGTCSGGYRVTLDDKGAMATGYPCHVPGYGVCLHNSIQWDEDSPKRARIKAELKRLRGAG